MKQSRDPIDAHVGRRLRLARTARGLSLEELGQRVGVTYQQVQKYETGANRVSASTLYRIARAFELAPSFFFEGLETEEAGTNVLLPDREAFQCALAISRIKDAQVRAAVRSLAEALAADAAG